MPRIVQFSRQPYFSSWDTRVFDPLPDFVLVPIGKCGIDMSVAFLKGNLDGITNLVGFALPGAKSNGWYFVPSVQGKSFAVWTKISCGLEQARVGLGCGGKVGHTLSFLRWPW